MEAQCPFCHRCAHERRADLERAQSKPALFVCIDVEACEARQSLMWNWLDDMAELFDPSHEASHQTRDRSAKPLI
jgi:hypothetical protein